MANTCTYLYMCAQTKNNGNNKGARTPKWVWYFEWAKDHLGLLSWSSERGRGSVLAVSAHVVRGLCSRTYPSIRSSASQSFSFMLREKEESNLTIYTSVWCLRFGAVWWGAAAHRNRLMIFEFVWFDENDNIDFSGQNLKNKVSSILIEADFHWKIMFFYFRKKFKFIKHFDRLLIVHAVQREFLYSCTGYYQIGEKYKIISSIIFMTISR